MELVKTTTPAVPEVVKYVGVCEFTVTSGQHLKIETSPGGEDILDVVVPAGKTWLIQGKMFVNEVVNGG